MLIIELEDSILTSEKKYSSATKDDTLLRNNVHFSVSMADKEMIQEKIGEALGLEKGAQKAVDELDSRGLLESAHMKKLSNKECS